MRVRSNDYLKKHPLRSFFIVSFALSWAAFGTFLYTWKVLLNGQTPGWLYFLLLGAYGPSIAAVFISKRLGGKQGVKSLFSRVKIWRVPIQWYGFVILIPALLHFAAISLSGFSGTAFREMNLSEMLISTPGYLLMALPFGPLAEELGWRGFAMPKMLNKWSPLKVSLLLGAIWTVWHIPLFWFPGATFPDFMGLSAYTIFLYTLMTIAEAMLFTFVYLRTKGSVLLAILFHLTLNASSNIIFAGLPKATDQQHINMYELHILCICLLAIASVFLNKRMTRPVPDD